MSKINVDEIKLKNYQDEAKSIINYFRNALHKHFEVVAYKSKHLINSRWNK